jgi:hypothetical protein
VASYPALAQVWCWTSHESTGSQVRDSERERSIPTYCSSVVRAGVQPRGLTPRHFTAENNYAMENGDHVLLLSTGQFVLLDKNRIVSEDEIKFRNDS